MINGVGQDAPITTNKNGGKQSDCPYAFDLIPPEAMFMLAQVLGYGAKRYAPNNWRLIPRHEHLRHMLTHIFAYMAGDTQDDHLGHAMCRMAMLVSVPEEAGHSYTEYVPKVDKTDREIVCGR